MASNLQRIKLIPNKKYKASGPKSYVYLLHKYKFTPTLPGPYHVGNKIHTQGKHGEGKAVGGRTHVQHVLQKKPPGSGESGNVPADDQQNDSQYLCHVTIGTPGQTFALDFDTGSADLWLWSTELPKSTTTNPPSPHTVYDPKKSSTYKAVKGSSWKISYGDGSSASGTVGTDNVNVGGLIIKAQSIELADTLSDQFQQDSSDGLLGLAFGSINTVTPKPVQTPVENMIAQDDISKTQELFTAYLGGYKDTANPDKGESFYTFGYLDQTALAGKTPSYTPVDNSQGFWMFQSTSAVVAGKTIQRAGNSAIADTGTTLALVDDAVCKAIYAAIPGGKYDDSQQGYVFPTSTTVDKLPIVSFAVGDAQFAVHKEDLAFADAGSGMSYGGIQSRGSMTFDILGDTWLKGIYAVFDQGNTRFGAVQRADLSK